MKCAIECDMVADIYKFKLLDLHNRRLWCAVTEILTNSFIGLVLAFFMAPQSAQAVTPADSAAQTSLSTPQAPTNTLVVGSEQDFPPFATGMTDASAGGFTVDLWRAVATEMDLSYTLRVKPFHQLLQEFKAGKIDVLINLAMSKERQQFANFSVPHVTVHGAIFVRKDQSSIQSENDLDGKSIIVLNADLAHDYALSKGWGKQLVLVETAAQGLGLLASGQHDAMLLSKLAGLQTLQTQALTNIKTLPVKAGFSQKFAFATHPLQTDLLAQLNEGLALTKANGVYNTLYEKWFGVYEHHEVGLRDVLNYVAPVVALFLIWMGYLFYRHQAERTLAAALIAESRDLLMTIIDTAPVRVFWKDRDLRYLGCNTAFVRDAGMKSSRDVIGKDDFQMGWATQAELYRSDDRAVMTSGTPKLFFEEPQTTPSGQTIWLRTSKVPLRNQKNEVFGILGIYEDITERRQAEETLRKLSTAIEQSPTSVVITDLNANIEYVNPQFTKVSGYSAAEAIGKNPRILQSKQTDEKIYRKLWKNLTSGETWHGELINRRKNGEVYWEESHIAPIINAENRITHYVAIKTDVTERIHSAKKLADLMREQKTILNNDLIGIVTVKDRKIVWANPAFEKMFGGTPGEFEGVATRQFFPTEEDYQAYGAEAYPILAVDQVFHTQRELIRKDGQHIWVDISGQMLNQATGESLWGFLDITLRKRMEDKVQQLAFHDTLTNLPNRRLLLDRLSQAVAASKRTGRYVAVMFLDLDNFKPLNDAHGHQAGDLLLMDVATRLTNCVREIDTVARIGGDEFVVMLRELNDNRDESLAQAQTISEKIRLALSEPYQLSVSHVGLPDVTVTHRCTASIGVAVFVGHEGNEDDVLKWADSAMYQAKDAGRNRVRFYGAKTSLKEHGG